MLILIAGITGMVGLPCAEEALKRGHEVRGLGRSISKVPVSLRSRLEGFEESSNMYDVTALDRAVRDVDAVICAYSYAPEVVLEGQLQLLRAAEKAGVKIFHAANWTYDWTRGYLGQHETYDAAIMFAAQARLTSKVKPILMMTGAITDYMFLHARPGTWDAETKTMPYFGEDPKQVVIQWTTVDDLAAFTVAAVESPDAAHGGIRRVQSYRVSLEGVASAYNAARGGKGVLTLQRQGSIADAEKMREEARRTVSPVEYEKYVGLGYAIHMARGDWDYEPEDLVKFSHVKTQTMQEWFEAHPDV